MSTYWCGLLKKSSKISSPGQCASFIFISITVVVLPELQTFGINHSFLGEFKGLFMKFLLRLSHLNCGLLMFWAI